MCDTSCRGWPHVQSALTVLPMWCKNNLVKANPSRRLQNKVSADRDRAVWTFQRCRSTKNRTDRLCRWSNHASQHKRVLYVPHKLRMSPVAKGVYCYWKMMALSSKATSFYVTLNATMVWHSFKVNIVVKLYDSGVSKKSSMHQWSRMLLSMLFGWRDRSTTWEATRVAQLWGAEIW